LLILFVDELSFSFLFIDVKGAILDVLDLFVLILYSGVAHPVPESELLDFNINQSQLFLQSVVLLF